VPVFLTTTKKMNQEQTQVPTVNAGPLKPLSKFKYAYSVNIDVEKGQDFGTFNSITRDKNGYFLSIHGAGMARVATYFTDNQVTDDPSDRLKHFKKVMDIIDGRKSERQLGVRVRQATMMDDERQLKDVLENFGGEILPDKINLASEIVQAAKEGGKLDMGGYL